ncbi:MAG: universal stress protein [Aggregatilineales bacterium]
MLKHVLVPLDGSTLSQTALEHAVRILDPNGKMTLLTVVEAPSVPIYDFYPTPTTVVTEYSNAVHDATPYATEYLERLAKKLQEQHQLQVEIEVDMGEPAALIIEAATRLNVDAIVMSTHGRSGLGRWLFGSVTQKVLSGSTRPVMVIPGQRSAEREKLSKDANTEKV